MQKVQCSLLWGTKLASDADVEKGLATEKGQKIRTARMVFGDPTNAENKPMNALTTINRVHSAAEAVSRSGAYSGYALQSMAVHDNFRTVLDAKLEAAQSDDRYSDAEKQLIKTYNVKVRKTKAEPKYDSFGTGELPEMKFDVA